MLTGSETLLKYKNKYGNLINRKYVILGDKYTYTNSLILNVILTRTRK